MTEKITLAAQADAGIERNDIGTSSWIAGAVNGKLVLSPVLYVAARGDYFYETVAEDAGTNAGAIFWPTQWMASGTATLAYQAVEGVSVRLEYRHDQADADVFFGGEVGADPMTMTFSPNRDTQDTATLGVTAWF